MSALAQKSVSQKLSTQAFLKSYFLQSRHLLVLVEKKVSESQAKKLKEVLQECSDFIECYRFRSNGPDCDYGNIVISKHVNIQKTFLSLKPQLDEHERDLGNEIISELYDLMESECKKFVSPSFENLKQKYFGGNLQ